MLWSWHLAEVVEHDMQRQRDSPRLRLVHVHQDRPAKHSTTVTGILQGWWHVNLNMMTGITVQGPRWRLRGIVGSGDFGGAG